MRDCVKGRSVGVKSDSMRSDGARSDGVHVSKCEV